MSLQVRDVDGERHGLRSEPGKGAKDRLVPLSATLLEQRRTYGRRYRPRDWLFPGRMPGERLSETSLQQAFTQAKARAGVKKIGGIHRRRQAYATHPLAAGLPVPRLQRLLGHRDLHATRRYVHWVPDHREGHGAHDLIATLGGRS